MKVENEYANDPRAVELRNWCNEVRGRTSELSGRVLKYKTSLSHYKYGRFKINDDLQERITECKKIIESEEIRLNIKKKPVKEQSCFKHSPKKSSNRISHKQKFLNENINFFKSIINDYKLSSLFEKKSKYSIDDIKRSIETGTYSFGLLQSAKLICKSIDVTTSDSEFVSKVEEWIDQGNKLQNFRLFNLVYGLNYKNGDMNSDHLDAIIKDHNDHNMTEIISTIEKCNFLIKNQHPMAIAASK
jgi:hypothetical protein